VLFDLFILPFVLAQGGANVGPDAAIDIKEQPQQSGSVENELQAKLKSDNDQLVEDEEKARIERDKADAAQLSLGDLFRYSETKDLLLVAVGTSQIVCTHVIQLIDSLKLHPPTYREFTMSLFQAPWLLQRVEQQLQS